jgi:hypothetical protein
MGAHFRRCELVFILCSRRARYWLAFPKTATTFEELARFCFPSWAMTIGLDTIFLLWAPLALLVIGFRALNHDIHRGPWAIVLTALIGLLAAIGFAFAFISAGRLITDATGIHDEHRAATIVIAGLVVLTAIAGALRYLMERLNIEAEALEYRDARGRFERAERRLARGSDPETGAPADEETARRLVYELGCLALTENEAWLKSRRERPLTPVVG